MAIVRGASKPVRGHGHGRGILVLSDRCTYGGKLRVGRLAEIFKVVQNGFWSTSDLGWTRPVIWGEYSFHVVFD